MFPNYCINDLKFLIISDVRKTTDRPGLCQLEQTMGSGDQSIPRYHFNKVSGKCENFIFKGWGGNENNFETLSECKKKCPGKF